MDIYSHLNGKAVYKAYIKTFKTNTHW